MATITLKGNPIETSGDLPANGTSAPDFNLTGTNLATVALSDFPGTRVLNIFPSVDTGICALSVKAFNAKAGATDGVTVLNISADLPFAHNRFCGAEGLDGVVSLSTLRDPEFADRYGVRITTGPLTGLCARAVVVVDGDGTVVYTEQVPEIAQEPNYDAALAALS